MHQSAEKLFQQLPTTGVEAGRKRIPFGEPTEDALIASATGSGYNAESIQAVPSVTHGHGLSAMHQSMW